MKPTNSIDKTIIAKNIKYFRSIYYMDQYELAEKIGVKRNTISYYENGKSTPDIERLKALANCFGVPIDCLCEPLLSYEYKPDKVFIKSTEIDKFFDFDILFPKVFNDNKAVEDSLYKQACIKHKYLFVKNYEFDIIKEIDNIYALYKESFETNNTLESACNMISLMLLKFSCKFDLDKMDYIPNNELFTITSKTIKEVFIDAEINKDKLKEKYDYFLSKQDEYIMLQRSIRKSGRFRNFSDFYCALCFNIGFVENANSATMNKLIFWNLIDQYATLGNKYAIDYIKML